MCVQEFEMTTQLPIVAENQLSTQPARFRRLGFVPFALVWLAFAAGSLGYCWRGGYAHPEIYVFLPHYLSCRPLLEKLYDCRKTDHDFYQSRELSYLMDWIDCRFIDSCVRHGHPHFMSVISLIFTFLITLLLWWLFVIELRIDYLSSLALVALILTSSCIFMGTVYYRSAKLGLALMIAVVSLIMTRVLRSKKATWVDGAAIFSVAFAATIFDRQGVLLVGMGIVLLGLAWPCFGGRVVAAPLVALMAAGLANFAYNGFISPQITLLTNGYIPDFSYQRLPMEKLADRPLVTFYQGVLLMLDTTRFLFGIMPYADVGNLSVPRAIGAGWLGLIGVLLCLRGRVGRDDSQSNPSALAEVDLDQAGLVKPKYIFILQFAVMVLSICALNTLMNVRLGQSVRHSPLLWPDIRRVYYWIPTTLLLAIVMGIALAGARGRLKIVLRFALLLGVVGNIASLPVHRQIVLNGHVKEFIEHGPVLLAGLRSLTDQSVAPSIEAVEDPLFQFWRDRLSIDQP